MQICAFTPAAVPLWSLAIGLSLCLFPFLSFDILRVFRLISLSIYSIARELGEGRLWGGPRISFYTKPHEFGNSL